MRAFLFSWIRGFPIKAFTALGHPECHHLVCYLVKIVIFVFLWLKGKESGLIAWVLLCSVGFSSLNIILFSLGNQKSLSELFKERLQAGNTSGGYSEIVGEILLLFCQIYNLGIAYSYRKMLFSTMGMF